MENEYKLLFLKDEEDRAYQIVLWVAKCHYERAKEIINNIIKEYHLGNEETLSNVEISGSLVEYFYDQLNGEFISFYVVEQNQDNTIYY